MKNVVDISKDKTLLIIEHRESSIQNYAKIFEVKNKKVNLKCAE